MVGAHALRQAKLQVPPGHDGAEPFRVRHGMRPAQPIHATQNGTYPGADVDDWPSQKYLSREHAEIDDVIDRDIDRCLPSHQRFRVVHGEAYVSDTVTFTFVHGAGAGDALVHGTGQDMRPQRSIAGRIERALRDRGRRPTYLNTSGVAVDLLVVLSS